MYQLKPLPLHIDIETKQVLKKVANARGALAELKGVASSIPNVKILINTLALQEAKDSSAVENIITTHDELFKAELDITSFESISAKEVQRYAFALKKGFELVANQSIISNSTLLKIHEELEMNNAGYRSVPGTKLENDKTKEIVYIPPQNNVEIKALMSNLIEYMNDDSIEEVDPLIKMAIIHHQFESIHPFYDGNGRTGRILNILYLVAKGLLDYPLLYLSRYIIQNKANYYKHLQNVRDDNDWESWILFMLDGIEVVSNQTISLIKEVKDVMQDYKVHLRNNYKYYSQDLLNNLFRHPYTKIEFLQNDLKVDRRTAAKYLNEISKDPVLKIKKLKMGNSNFYINNALLDMLTNYDYNIESR